MAILRFPESAQEIFVKESTSVLEDLNEILLERFAEIGLHLDAEDTGPSPNALRGAIKVAAAYISDLETPALAARVIEEAEEHHKSEVERSFREAGAQISVQPQIRDEALEDFQKLMAKRYEDSLEEHLEFIQERTVEGMSEGKRAAEIAEAFAERTDAAKDKMTLLARDSLGSLKSFQDQHRMQTLGVEHYRWLTAEDERVRMTHRALADTIQRWDQPTLVGHPGQDWGCRCDSAPIIK